MNWAEPGWLLVLGLVAGLAAIVLGAAWLHRKRLLNAFGGVLFEQVLPGSVRLRRGARDAMALVGLALVVLALAEPRFDKEIRSVKASGVDLVLVLDLSKSMDAQDVKPSRLERARREIEDLFKVLQADRVGLVVYAGNAWPLLPLTEDLHAVQSFVDDLDTDSFDAQGSALGAAIEAGVQVLDGSMGASGKAILVLSDGELHEDDDALAQADVAAGKGVVIYAMGIGEAPAPIPVPGGFLGWEGEQVMSTPDEATLKELARRTGGAYVKSVASNQDVVGLYQGEMRRKLTVVERDSSDREVWRSAFQWPLGLGLLLLIAGAWTGDGRRPLGAAAALVLALAALGGPGVAQATTLAEADQAYRDGRFDDAANQLTELSLQDPKNPALFERLGAARYRAGDFEGAARAFDAAAQIEGGTDAETLYNAGNAHWRAGRLEEASQRFSDVLAAQPENTRAKTNAEILAKELEARRNQPPPPPPKPQSGDDKEDENGGGDEQDPNQSPEGQGSEDQQSEGDSDQEQPQGEDDQEQPPDQGGESDPQPSQGEDSEQGENDQMEQGGSPSDQYGEEQEITAGQAERMLDSVEEGKRRIKVPGKPGGKPW